MASFSLYPTVDQTALANAFNITVDCLEALNASLPCEPTLLQMTSDVDNYWWEEDNVTTLCTTECWSAVDGWDQDVQARCDDQTLVAYGKLVPADSVSGRYYDGLHMACLTNGNSTAEDDFAWCVVESQNWVGSDVIQPGNTNSDDPANQRLANLYGDDVLCTECYIQLLFQRLSSPYLPSGDDYSAYLIEQYQDILDVCNYTDQMPELVITAQPDYDDAPVPALNLTVATGCSGQLITVSSLDPNANCATIAQAFNVATGAVQDATGSQDCADTSSSSFCLPLPCTIDQVPTGATCASLAAAASYVNATVNFTVTTVQFLAWNPHINGICDNLQAGDYYCTSAPGGLYIPPAPPANSSYDDSSQSRGGNVGSDAGSGTGLSPSGVGSNAPSPTQTGIAAGCSAYAQADTPGQGCADFAAANGITPAQLYAWNTVLGPGGADCGTQFFLGYYYCISAAAATTTSTGPPGPPGPPGPTQSGIPVTCDEYAEASSGQTCGSFATANGITTAQFYAWNPVLGANGENCASSFWADEYYCVGVTAPPGPTQSGIPDTCDKYAEASSGQTCGSFASANGITTAQLYIWNPVLGANGENCATSFWADEYYCVGGPRAERAPVPRAIRLDLGIPLPAALRRAHHDEISHGPGLDVDQQPAPVAAALCQHGHVWRDPAGPVRRQHAVDGAAAERPAQEPVAVVPAEGHRRGADQRVALAALGVALGGGDDGHVAEEVAHRVRLGAQPRQERVCQCRPA
ncbi:hypothetical protein VM1G_02901 [Cytospora mali]|uniref:LysM domain-containing protein n=1 Tax=Cytospora mali TaxID=578113 RepID=A0A194VTC6_CYTMA|nr:hypothetical protein VM1G_02901 [Valsa mali]